MLVAMLSIAVWAKPLNLYYENRPLTADASGMGLQDLRSYVVRRLGANGLRMVEDIGAETRTVRPMSRKNTAPELVRAASVALVHKVRGAELDLLVPGEHNLVPVTVRWEKRELVVQSGPPTTGVFPQGPTHEMLQADFGVTLQERGDRTWEPSARGFVAAALRKLSSSELERVRDVPIVRVASPPPAMKHAGMELLAAYIFDRQNVRIEVYDAALTPQPRFVGSPEDPHPMAFAAVLHELGHALAGQTQREALSKLPPDTSEKEIGELFDSQSPVLEAYKQARGSEQAPTGYGRTTVEEGFAESFALFHADRAALARTSPLALEWLQNGGHLK